MLQDSELSKVIWGASGRDFKGAVDVAGEGSPPEEAWLQPVSLSPEGVGTVTQQIIQDNIQNSVQQTANPLQLFLGI